VRLHFTLELENEKLPIDYRRKVISYLKFCIEKSDSDFYEDCYGIGKNESKDFAMAVYFIPETQFCKDSIYVRSKKMVLNISTPDAYVGIQLYNALCSQKFVWYKLADDNAVRMVSAHSEKEKVITQRRAMFNTLSPIVIRDHNSETGKDWFYTFEDEKAADILKRNLKSELEGKFDRDISYDIDSLQIEFIKMKKVIVQSYELKIACSLGTFSLEGEQYLLEYLYQRGIGSKRSLIFGYLELI